jgi:hypothetical protein
MEKGWKPMPVILKIVWIILIVNAFFSLLALGGIYSNGFDFMGFPLYGLYAINVLFLTKIVLPVVIIVGMHQRYRWVWIVAAGYYLMFAINGFASIDLVEETKIKIFEQMPEIPEGVTEELYYQMINWVLVLSFILSALFDLTLMIFILIKRKYFSIVKHLGTP